VSIRQRPYVLRKQSAFGGLDERRPYWGDLGPILLRSAGIVGAAGVIMAIVGGGAFFTDTRRTPRERPATPTILHQETVSADETAAAAAPVVAEALSAPPAGRFSEDEPLAYVPPAPATTPAEPAAPRIANRADVDTGDASPTASALSSVDPARFEAVSPDPLAEPEDPLWKEEAVACPRAWVHAAEADTAGNSSADCETEAALAAADAASPDLEAALDEAASKEAVEIVGFIARVPIPRPEPPTTPVRRRSTQPSSWPDEPPPNCGTKHAYWHFVDRKNHVKEWYCR
jgi:hypothetical protein